MNMANAHYEKYTPNDSKVDYYRHFYRVTEHYLPVLNLAIVINRKNEEMKLVIEPNDFFNDKKLFAIFWRIKTSKEVGQFYYDGEGTLFDYEFAAEIYKYLHFEFIEMSYCGIPLFDKRRTDVFVQTFDDFHKMVSGNLIL